MTSQNQNDETIIESETIAEEQSVPKISREKTVEDLAEEYLNDAKRIQAEFDNYKRRQEESRKKLAGFLIEKFLMDLLPVMDNFRAATLHVPVEAAGSPWVTGIFYIEQQLEKVLADQGVSVISVAVGDVFNPALHEAISQEAGKPSQDAASKVAPGGEFVTKVLQNGYRIDERVVRPAKVVVALG